MSGSRKVGLDADHDCIYDVIGYLRKLCVIWTISQLLKNSGPLNNTFDVMPLHLTFQGDVVLLLGFPAVFQKIEGIKEVIIMEHGEVP